MSDIGNVITELLSKFQPQVSSYVSKEIVSFLANHVFQGQVGNCCADPDAVEGAFFLRFDQIFYQKSTDMQNDLKTIRTNNLLAIVIFILTIIAAAIKL